MCFVLVTSLGTCLKGVGGDESGGDCIMLAGHDELFLLSSLHRNLYRTTYDKKNSASGVSEALSDLKSILSGARGLGSQ